MREKVHALTLSGRMLWVKTAGFISSLSAPYQVPISVAGTLQAICVGNESAKLPNR